MAAAMCSDHTSDAAYEVISSRVLASMEAAMFELEWPKNGHANDQN